MWKRLTQAFLSANGLFLAGCFDRTETIPVEKLDLQTVLASPLSDAAGQAVSKDAFKGKYVGFYFSASWCPPCRAFTPDLLAFRNAHSDAFEVVLVGADRSAAEQAQYMHKYEMPWPALAFGSKKSSELSETLGIRGIPAMVVVGPDGTVLSTKGREEVQSLGARALEEWKKRQEP